MCVQRGDAWEGQFCFALVENNLAACQVENLHTIRHAHYDALYNNRRARNIRSGKVASPVSKILAFHCVIMSLHKKNDILLNGNVG